MKHELVCVLGENLALEKSLEWSEDSSDSDLRCSWSGCLVRVATKESYKHLAPSDNIQDTSCFMDCLILMRKTTIIMIFEYFIF